MTTQADGAVLVTGAGSGIGAETARQIAAAGAAVAVNDLDPAAAQTTADTVVAAGGTAYPVAGDVADPRSAAAVVAAAVDRLGRLTGLVNNVGVVRGGALRSVSPDDWDAIMRIDCASALYCSQAALPAMTSGGAIVNISSLCGIHVAPGAGAYNAAKAAVIALTRQMALEWGPDGIRANAVAPGIVSGTNFSASSRDPQAALRRGAAVPLGRTGSATDIAPVVVFLLGDAARYVTGQVIAVDGGLGVALQTLLPA
ncbi:MULTISPECIES: SDR family NAD(P)-dependent oxidoreductase [unclassified Micromonospora]|uniref:SDR family NAD(P)-dependent oxidoreductase n=1 Tax=unclassified Micromonospora TaxID=2617518 RepID=UPI003A88E8B1